MSNKTQKIKIFKLLYEVIGREKADEIRKAVNLIDDIYYSEINMILTEVHTACEDLFLCHEMAAYSRLKKLIENDSLNIELKNYDFNLSPLNIGDYVKCLHSKAKNLTNGKEYKILDCFFVYPDNKWVGKIKADNGTRINVRETGRFCVGKSNH